MPKKFLLLTIVILGAILTLLLEPTANGSTKEQTPGLFEESSKISDRNSASVGEAQQLEDQRTEIEEQAAIDVAKDPELATVQVKLLQPNGQAALDAGILRGNSGNRFGAPNFTNDAAFADSSGIAQLQLKPGSRTIFTIGGERWVAQEITVGALQKGDHKFLGEFVLSPAAIIRGTVYSPDDKPTFEAKISLHKDNENEWDNKFAINTTLSNINGEYSLGSVPLGKWKIIATINDAQPLIEKLELAAGDINTLDFHLQQGASISGMVLDENEQAISDARIKVFRPRDLNNNWDYAATVYDVLNGGIKVDTDGRFKVYGLIGDGKDGIAAEASNCEQSLLNNVQPGDGAIIYLKRKFTLEGQLLAADGSPAANTRISLVNKSPDGNWSQGARTDENGNFNLESLSKANWNLLVDCEFGSINKSIDLNEASEHVYQPEATNCLTVVVVDSHNNPISDININIQKENGDDDYLSNSQNRNTRSDAAGTC